MSSSDQVPDCKRSLWPELIGKSIEDAEKVIKEDRPDVKTVDAISLGDGVTDDFRLDRVRIFVDTVIQIPRIG